MERGIMNLFRRIKGFMARDKVKFLIITSIIVAGMIIEAASAWNYYDVHYFIAWDEIIRKHGLPFVYKYASKAAYPPLSILVFVSMYEVAKSFNADTTTTPLIRVVVKIPLIICIIVIAYVLFRYYGWSSVKWLYLSLALYSTILGYQFDLITAAGILLAILFIYRKKNYFLGGLAYSLSVLTKQLTGILLPLFLYDAYKERRAKGIIEFIIGFLTLSLPITLPFVVCSFKEFLERTVLFHGTRYPQDLSIYAIPVYYYAYEVHGIYFIPRFLTWIWMPVFALAYVISMAYLIRRAKISEDCGIIKYAIILLLSIMLNKVGNTPYYVWPLPLLAVIMARYGSMFRKMRLAYILAPVISMILYPYFTLFTAAVVKSGFFIVEDLQFYNAYTLFITSFKEAPVNIGLKLVEWNRKYLLWLYTFIYDNEWLLITISTILYLTLIAYMVRCLIILYRSRCVGACND